MMNTHISYSHILIVLALLLAALLVGTAITTVNPGGAGTAYASNGAVSSASVAQSD